MRGRQSSLSVAPPGDGVYNVDDIDDSTRTIKSFRPLRHRVARRLVPNMGIVLMAVVLCLGKYYCITVVCVSEMNC